MQWDYAYCRLTEQPNAAFHAAVLKAMATPETKSRLPAQGVEIVGGGPREIDQTISEEITKWATLVRTAGITAE